MEERLVSVILAFHNSEVYLDEALLSLAEQKLERLELIAVDDFSRDRSREIFLDRFGDSSLSKLICNKANLGLAMSLNVALKESSGSLMARMDADDIADSNRLLRQLEYMESHPEIDILGSNAMLIDMNSEVVGQTDVPLTHDEIVSALEFRNPMIHPSIMMKRSVLEKLGGYDESLRKAQDLDLWHRAAKAGFRFANLPDCLIKYRVDLNKSSKTIFKGFFVSLGYALRNRSIKGLIFACIDLGKYFLIKFGLYTPRSLRGKR